MHIYSHMCTHAHANTHIGWITFKWAPLWPHSKGQNTWSQVWCSKNAHLWEQNDSLWMNHSFELDFFNEQSDSVHKTDLNDSFMNSWMIHSQVQLTDSHQVNISLKENITISHRILYSNFYTVNYNVILIILLVNNGLHFDLLITHKVRL